MPSFEDRFYRQNPSMLQRLGRNSQLVSWLAGRVLAWFYPGRRLRKAYIKAQQERQQIVLEDFIK